MDLVAEVYQLAAGLPWLDRFELASQMRRAAVSVPSNLAEGYGRAHRGEYRNFVSIANGSLKELETHVLVAIRVGHLGRERAEKALALAAEVGKMLHALRRALDG